MLERDLTVPATEERQHLRGRDTPQSRWFPLVRVAAWVAIVFLWGTWLLGAWFYVRAIPTDLDTILGLPGTRWTAEMIRAAASGSGISPTVSAWVWFGMELLLVTTFGAAGVILFRHKQDSFGAFLGVALVLIATRIGGPVTFILFIQWPALKLSSNFLSGLAFVAFGALLYLFPDGRFVPAWTRWVPLLTCLPLVWPDSGKYSGLTTAVALTYLGTGLAGQVYRYRHLSDNVARRHTRWIIASFAAFVGVILSFLLIAPNAITMTRPPSPGDYLASLLVGPLITAASISFVIALSVAILRDGLYNLDILINRALVYGGLTALITAVYALFVGGVGFMAGRGGIVAGLVVATAITVGTARPLHHRLQTTANRLIPFPQPIPTSRPDISLPQTRSWTIPLAAGLFGFHLLSIAGLFVLQISGCSLYTLQDLSAIVSGPGVMLVFATLGLFIVKFRPDNRIGWLCLGIGSLAVVNLLYQYTHCGLTGAVAPVGLGYSAWVAYTLAPQLFFGAMFMFLPLLFPTGHFLSPRWQQFAVGILLLIAILTLAVMVVPNFSQDNGFGVSYPLTNPLGWSQAPAWWGTFFTQTLNMVVLFGCLAGIFSLVLRLKRSQGDERQQLKWFAFFLATVVTIQLVVFELIIFTLLPQLADNALIAFAYQLIIVLVFLGFPLTIGIAIFKYRLYDIDILINRTLIYGSLTVVIIALYALAVGGLSLAFQAQNNLLLSLLATGLIAVFFQPVRERLQQGANRLLYGDRDDPYRVLSRLGRQLQETAVPGHLLPAITQTISQALKLPYVAVALTSVAGERRLAAMTGHPSTVTEEWPLLYQGELVGWLIVAPRSPQEPFTNREKELLADIAGQAGAAAYSDRLTTALQRSRERLVLAGEEERRRIRRDLHDGFGPTLASQTFKLDAALELLETDPDAAANVLLSLKSQNQGLIADIRRLVYALRPPSLDELGLLVALQVHISQMSLGNNGLKVTVAAAPDPLPPLPAAVEVAAYRITLEAITNVVRHARASQCQVSLEHMTDHLIITITDDGHGLPPETQPGVGLISMRERTEELGGRFTITANPTSGTHITALLPLLPTQMGSITEDLP